MTYPRRRSPGRQCGSPSTPVPSSSQTRRASLEVGGDYADLRKVKCIIFLVVSHITTARISKITTSYGTWICFETYRCMMLREIQHW